MKSTVVSLLLVMLLLCMQHTASAFGRTGHQIIAKIAMQYLTPAA